MRKQKFQETELLRVNVEPLVAIGFLDMANVDVYHNMKTLKKHKENDIFMLLAL